MPERGIELKMFWLRERLQILKQKQLVTWTNNSVLKQTILLIMSFIKLVPMAITLSWRLVFFRRDIWAWTRGWSFIELTKYDKFNILWNQRVQKKMKTVRDICEKENSSDVSIKKHLQEKNYAYKLCCIWLYELFKWRQNFQVFTKSQQYFGKRS